MQSHSRADPKDRRGWQRLLSLLSLVLVTALVEGYLWWGKFQYQHSVLLAGTALIVVTIVSLNHWMQGDDLRVTGLRLDNWRPALRLYGSATVILALCIVLPGLFLGHFSPVTLVGAVSYLGWALLQQHLLQNFYSLRLSQLLAKSGRRGPLGAAMAALIFALLHWPNDPLVLLTLAGGLLWCFLFLWTPNLWGAVSSQVILTLALMFFFKFGGLRQFEVGAPGMRFDYFGEGVRVAAGHGAAGQVRIGTLPGPDRGHPALLRIFDLSGMLVAQWNAFPEYDFSGELAIGRVDSMTAELVAVAAGPGYPNPPRIRLFRFSGELLRSIDLPEFPPHQGAWVAIGCGRIYAAPGPGPESPQVLLELTADGRVTRHWEFPQLPFRNGLRGQGLCPPDAPDGPASTLILWATDLATNPSSLFVYRTQTGRLSEVETLGTTFGAQLTPLIFDHRQAVAVSPGPLRGYPGVVRVQTLKGEILRQLTFSQDPGRYGNTVAGIDLDEDGTDELVLGEGTGPKRGFEVQIRDLQGNLIHSWEAYREDEFP